MTNEQLALVLEKVAAYVGAVEAQNHELSSTAEAVRTKTQVAEAEKLAALYEKATGQTADAAVMQKIAQIDDDQVKSLFTALTKTAAAEADSLGRPSDRFAPRDKTASAEDPDEAFLGWCLS
ncbi:MAG: hypothetical protein ACNA8W_24860 [Bradymonadaceae bacterium]